MRLQKKQLKDNIKKNYAFSFIQNIDLTRGIWMIYLASKGMTLTQLGLLETIFHLTSFFMEVPTGAVADIYGRRVSRIIGRLFSVISVIILLFADSFIWFAGSFIITALSYNMESGAGDALIYDTMKEIGQEDQYMRISGNKEMIFQIGSIISFLLGGYLATKSYDMAFVITIVIGMITFLYAFLFVEPTTGKKSSEKSNRTHFFDQLSESIKVLREQKRLGFLILFSQFIMSFVTTVFFYLQNYMKGDGYSEASIGVLYAVTALGGALLAPQVYKIENIIKERGILLFMPIITTLCLFGVALSKWHFMFFIPMALAEGLIFIALGDYINKVIPSENRATILSMASMAFSFFMITIFPVVGFIGDQFGLKVSFFMMAIVGMLLTAVNSWTLLRNKN
ncbi:MAG TPA: MFS transporter [Clostridiales bacterium UBA8960]|nr:MFS transporter [Clostridiales bacterium UBA8960]